MQHTRAAAARPQCARPIDECPDKRALGGRTSTRLYNRVRYHFRGSKGVRHDTAKQIMLAANAHVFRRIESDKGIVRHEVFWPGVTRGRITVRCNLVAQKIR